MFRQARKRFLNFWAITGLIFSGLLTSFIVHDMMAQDVSGGGSSSTSVVTGTDEECKETETGRISGIKCIIHTHVYTETSVDTKCIPKTYVAPTDNGNYCITQKITISATSTGKDTPGKTIKTYGPCRICGAAYPGKNPDEIPHNPTWPTIKWIANDCDAKESNGDGDAATFMAYEVSTSVNSSSVVFSEKSPGICSIVPPCGTINALFNPATTNFTVEKVESVTCENIISVKADPKKPETLYLANKGWDKTPDPDELTKTITAKLKPDDATPTDDKSWTGDGIQAPNPANSLTATWKSKEFKIHALSYGCAHSKKALNIAVEGASIVSAVADSDEEMTEKYLRVFVNEDFTKGKDASPVLDGHYKCKIPDKDVDDYEPPAGRDELVGFSLKWLKFQGTDFDDTDAQLQLVGYDGKAKIYIGSNEDDMKLYDGAMHNIDEYWAKRGCLKIEGTFTGLFTLQLKMQTRDVTEAVLVDQVKVKVFPLNISAIEPTTSSDTHEICDKKLLIKVNEDDSDNDGIIDLNDNNVSSQSLPDGDPDLGKITIRKPDEITQEDIASNIKLILPSDVKAYKNRKKTEAVPNETTFELSALPIDLYLEGTKFGSDILDSKVTIQMTLVGGAVCRDEIRYSVIGIEKVEWKAKNTPLDDNPNIGGGLRIIPDKNDPYDTADHSKVIIKAIIKPKLQGIPVYFKVFDVDDPSSDKKPIDDESQAYDNYGTKVAENIISSTTDENGEAIIEYSVSIQPGDNFKAVAMLFESNFKGMKAENAGRTDSRVLKGSTPVSSNNITNMLTVWRRLWIEVDSMDFPKDLRTEMNPDWDTVVIEKCIVSKGEGVTKVKLGWADDSDHVDCFEGGELETFIGNFKIMKNKKASLLGKLEVTIIGELTDRQCSLLNDTIAMAKEDDQLSSLSHSSDIPGLAINALKKTYIFVEKINISYEHDFKIHSSYTDILKLGLSSVKSDNGFWYQLVLNAFQYNRDEDYDADSVYYKSDGTLALNINSNAEDATIGATPAGWPDSWNVSLLFLEPIRDENFAAPILGLPLIDYGLVFAHEVGHSGRNDTLHIEDGIMNEEGQSKIGGKPMDYYDDDTVFRFRSQPIW